MRCLTRNVESTVVCLSFIHKSVRWALLPVCCLDGQECPSYFKPVDFILDAIVVIYRPHFISSGSSFHRSEQAPRRSGTAVTTRRNRAELVPAYKDLCIKNRAGNQSLSDYRKYILPNGLMHINRLNADVSMMLHCNRTCSSSDKHRSLMLRIRPVIVSWTASIIHGTK